jgi:hypothetical protein
MATDYGLNNWVSTADIKIFLFSTVSRLVLGPTQSPINLIPGALSPGIKRPWREDNHSPQYSAEVRNGGAIPQLSHMSSLRGTHGQPRFYLSTYRSRIFYDYCQSLIKIPGNLSSLINAYFTDTFFLNSTSQFINEELHTLDSSPDVIRMIKPRRARGAVNVEQIGE